MTHKELLNTDGSGLSIGFSEMLLLSADEVPNNRIPLLKKLADSQNDLALTIDASCLLSAWGDKGYVDRLKYYCDSRIDQQGNFRPHRLRNYDQTYEYFLTALISYWLWYDDIGKAEADKAREYIFSTIVLIIELASVCPFELKELYDFVNKRGWKEYVPYIKTHLELLFESPIQHQWKFVDAIKFLDKYDDYFVTELLTLHGKTRSDYPLDK
tara:strand:- start:411 stop:1049 length:639 start_codon:yes stop_codon:yes gene_type:complete